MIPLADLKNKTYAKISKLDYLKFHMILKISWWIPVNFWDLSMTPGGIDSYVLISILPSVKKI